jgi:hypothetical protein
MDDRPAVVELDRGGESPNFSRVTGLSPEAVATMIRSLEGESDITATIRREGSDARLLVAVSGNSAFVGLHSSDGIFQYVAHGDQRVGTRLLSVGGQDTRIKSRYISEVTAAADVVREWLLEGIDASPGAWERT